MKHFLLLYDFVPDVAERRAPFRKAHLEHGFAAAARGELVLGGACLDAGAPLGVLLFQAADRKVAEDFAKADPYVINGVAASWQVREWTTVLGKDALTKVTL